MSDVVYKDVFLSSGTFANGSAAVSGLLFVFFLVLALCWKHWNLVRPYRCFPSRRFDIELLLPVILGRYPKNAPFVNFIFQKCLKLANDFQDEGLCLMWLFKPYLFVFNEKYVKNLMNEVDLAEKNATFEINKLIFGDGLLSSKPDVWKVHRKLLNPAFSVGVLKGKIHVLNKYACQLADKLETFVDRPGDAAWEAIKYTSFLNMADFVLGLKLDNEKHASLAKKFIENAESGGELFIERITRPWLYWDFMLPFFRSGRNYLKMIDEINRLAREILNELIEKNSVNKDQSNYDSQVASSCGDILMKLYLDDFALTEKDIRDQLITFAAAGYDTVSVTMLWCFYTLGHHPQVQDKAYNEIRSIVPEGDITNEDLTKLKYLDCVIKETMRLYSTVPMFGRRATKDIHCGNYTIPKNTQVCFFTFMLHRDPNVFPDPEKFDPDRFLDSSSIRPWMYIPFAEGYRNCIGKKFAMMEMKIQLVHVLRRFRITSLNKVNDSDLLWVITVRPTKPLLFSFENRTPSV